MEARSRAAGAGCAGRRPGAGSSCWSRPPQIGRRRQTDDADARSLAEALDGLALALEQAGAYISDSVARWRSTWIGGGSKRKTSWSGPMIF